MLLSAARGETKNGGSSSGLYNHRPFSFYIVIKSRIERNGVSCAYPVTNSDRACRIFPFRYKNEHFLNIWHQKLTQTVWFYPILFEGINDKKR